MGVGCLAGVQVVADPCHRMEFKHRQPHSEVPQEIALIAKPQSPEGLIMVAQWVGLQDFLVVFC
jgi:hypothetical protein